MIDKPAPEKTRDRIVVANTKRRHGYRSPMARSGAGRWADRNGWHNIPVDKPKNFFRVHPDPGYRRRTEIYVHKPEGAVDTEFYILARQCGAKLDEARPCILTFCIYRDGTPRLWPLMLPRDGEKDNDAWTSARAAARDAMKKWVRLVWKQRSYQTREAQPGYAPDPDWRRCRLSMIWYSLRSGRTA